MSAATPPLPPGSVIGIVGGGQLGRMTAVAAAELGYRVHVFTPERNSPTEQVAERAVVADYEDQAAIRDFGEKVDVVTFEFENVPAETVRRLAELAPVRPNWECLAICQDRVREKTFCNDLGIGTAPWREVNSLDDLTRAIADLGAPSILKTNRLGYDGKGQARIQADTDPALAWHEVGGQPCVLEGFVDFTMEVSVITARRPGGAMAAFDVVENRHKNGILDVTIAPANIPEALADEARAIGRKMTEAMDLVGLLAVEMFVTRDGRLLVNEMAPRPHNSGHWTQDGCKTSQFEQFVRAVAGLPLGTVQRHSDTVMRNLLGDDALLWEQHLSDPENKLHLYGKAEPRPGRKMGHINRLYPLGSRPKG
ncbi:MAG: 5-(carboxyamino)imidazole ribonucleotide synthase [Alphaproteobacteria bacterium]|nr:5-(carboxyamino)imidazole ribonucleotide synthase [Alphaproteobacteria bacterium]MBF0250681.1 5-(carboxyamino)imidazole ribonucleotide synthase [Alphaproteobacteria bacterium]